MNTIYEDDIAIPAKIKSTKVTEFTPIYAAAENCPIGKSCLLQPPTKEDLKDPQGNLVYNLRKYLKGIEGKKFEVRAEGTGARVWNVTKVEAVKDAAEGTQVDAAESTITDEVLPTMDGGADATIS